MAKFKTGDIVVTEDGTIGLIKDVSNNDYSIHIVKRVGLAKSAWYDESELQLLISIDDNIKMAEEIYNSPLFKALNEL